MNMVASVFRSRADCSTKPQFEQLSFLKLDSTTNDTITFSMEVHHGINIFPLSNFLELFLHQFLFF